MHGYKLTGGVIVSGSFQVFDQSYLIQALSDLGESFVGVTQLPASVTDDEILQLNSLGVRAIRFNLKCGGSEVISHLSSLAARVHEIANWHVELYVDSNELDELYSTLIKLPALSIDHLGLSQSGFKRLKQLAENGVKIKAIGFSRVDFNVTNALKQLYSINSSALMFGSDMPSTRAPTAYSDNDFTRVAEALEEEAAIKVFSENAIEFYKPQKSIIIVNVQQQRCDT